MPASTHTQKECNRTTHARISPECSCVLSFFLIFALLREGWRDGSAAASDSHGAHLLRLLE